MSEVSKVPAFLTAFVEALQDREALAGIQISKAAMLEETEAISIQLFRVRDITIDGALGKQKRKESFTVSGACWYTAYGAGAEGIDEALTGAYMLLGEIQKTITDDPHLGGVVHVYSLATHNLRQGVTDGGRFAQIDFTLEVEAYLIRA